MNLYQAANQRIAELTADVLKRFGPVVQAGPFAGMKLPHSHGGSAYLPKLLGCYEQELADIKQRSACCDQVYNIGCGEGYYAVGLAIAGRKVLALDTDPLARNACALNASANNADLLILGERWHPSLAFSPNAYILCDVEGAEGEILNPYANGMRSATLLVECHEFSHTGILGELVRRFDGTHNHRVIGHAGRDPYQIPAIKDWSQLGQALATLEGRPGPTPWLFLTPR